MGDDPPYLMVGTEVSAKYKGAFCEAKIRKVVRVVKCRVTFKAGLGSATIPDDHIKGDLRVGSTVEAKHPDKNQFIEATINKIQDSSQYTVVFDDGDITTLRRSALCLKSGRHFNESETLDQLPLTHPEHFSNPVVGGRRGVRRRAANNDDNDNESSDDEDVPAKKGRKKPNKEADMGKVVCVESTDKKKNSKDSWFPALIVCPSAQDTVKIRTKDEYLVRSFRDGRYYTVPKKETTEFTKDSINKSEHSSNLLRTACDKAVQYLERNDLPPHWDREVLFGHGNTGEGSDEGLSDSGSSEDETHEEKDRFVAQLYKFMDDCGSPIVKVPAIGGKDLDLHKLYQVVMSKGGYNKVCNAGQWKAVTVKMGYGASPAMVTVNFLKQSYKKLLQNFEEFYRKMGPFDSLNALSNSGSKSRSNRSIFRDRSTKDTKKEEVKDEDDKKSVGSAPGASSSVAGESPEEIDAETESVYSEKLEADRSEEPRRSRSRLDSRGKKESEELSEKKGKRNSKKKDSEREKERENSRTPVSASPSPAPSNKRGGLGGRNRKKKENATEPEELKSEPEESHDHIDKTVKIHKGDKVQVYYGPKSKGNVTYKAKVIDIDEAGSIPKYLVHYTGWNTRYDEWIERYRIASLSPQKDMGKDTNGEASEADSNGGTGGGKPPATKVVKRKGRPSGGQSKKTGGVRKNQTSEADKPRKGRVRKRSERDIQSGSGSDADSSDSDDKQMPKVTTPSSDSSVASSSAVDGRSRKDAAQRAEQINDDDDSSSSSSVGAAASVSKKSESGAGGSDDIGESPPNVGSSAIDLAKIRSEMKGLDKLVKIAQHSAVGSSSPTTIPRSSSPVPAASVCVPQTEIKLDVYEFQEDVSDAPKLKIFQPTRSPDRKDEHVSLKEEDKSQRNYGDSDSAASSRPGTPSKVSHGQHREDAPKKEKKKKEKEEDSPVYSPIKIPKPLLAAKESTKLFPSTPTSAFSGPRASGIVQSLQPSFPVEGKANLRMHTPLIHTPTQPVRQRAIITSYPPPLIPSGASKPPLSAAPVSTVITSSPPMPSLTQRPALVSPPANPVPAPQLHPQVLHQVRPVAPPRAVAVPPYGSTSQVSLPPSQSVQSAGTSAHNFHENSKPFMARQQELYPHLAQQASPKPVPLTVPKAPLPPVSITPVTSVHAPMDAANPPTNLAQSGVSSAGKDTSRISLGISGPPSSGLGFATTVPKKSPVKRKQPSKEKLPKSPPSLMVSPGNTAARMDQSHLPPKKKAKKVITKNIIDPCKTDPEQVPSTFKAESGVESPTKKARKPAKKRITQSESLGETAPGVFLPSSERVKSPNKSPTKVLKKKPKMLIDTSGPPQLLPAKVQKATPPTSYMGTVSQVPVPPSIAASGAFSLITQSSLAVPCEVKSSMAYVEPVSRAMPPAKAVATLGNFSVMNPQDCKSYTPKAMGIAGLPRMMATAADSVGKPPDHISGTVTSMSTNNPKGISVPNVPPVATTTYVRMPNRFDPSPVVIATLTGPALAPQKPITVIPLRTMASPTSSAQQRMLGNAPEPNKCVSGVPVVTACDSRPDPKIKPVVVVPTPKGSPPSASAQPSIPVIKIPEVKEEKDDWRLADNDTPVCLVMKEESAASKSSIKVKEELEDDDIKPTDLSFTATQASSDRSKSSGDRQEDQNAKEEDESCNSLLCEEEIPGSPPPGEESSFFGAEEENALSNPPCKKETNPIVPDQKSVTAESWKESKPEDKAPRSFALEGSNSRKASTDGPQERPGNTGNNHDRQQQPAPLVFNNNHHQQNLHHVIDNTPPTTPESSSLSSGSPRVDGGRVSPSNDHPSSSKSKDSSDLDSNDKMAEMNEEGSSSDAGRKYVKDSASSPQKKRHTESSRSAGNASPPGKRRRVQRRKSPDDMRSYTSYRGRSSAGGRKGTEKDMDHGKIQPPPPPINLTRPPVSKKFNLIPSLDETMDSEMRIQALQQALQTIKEKYQEVKSELSSEERRLKRFKRRLKDREKEKSKTVKST